MSVSLKPLEHLEVEAPLMRWVLNALQFLAM